MDNEVFASDACRAGAYLARLLAALQAVLALLSLATGRPIVAGVDASALIDAALFVLVAWGLSRHARWAAVTGFSVLAIGTVPHLMNVGSMLGVAGLIVRTFALLVFVGAIRGAFAYRRHRLAIANARLT